MSKSSRDKGLFQRGQRQSWYLRAYVPGQGKKVFALKPDGSKQATTDKSVARVLARRIRQQIKGKVALERPKSFGELVETFAKVSELDGKPQQAKRNKSIVQRFIDAHNIKGVEQITSTAIQDYMADLSSKGHAPSTIWNHRGAISKFCEFLKSRALIEFNPAREAKAPKKKKPLPVFLTPAEEKQTLAIAKKHGIYAEVATALFTGLRLSELRRIRWQDVDFDNRTLIVPESKSGRPRAVPLSKSALDVITGQQTVTGQSKFIFPGQERIDYTGMRRIGWWVSALEPIQAEVLKFSDRDERSVGRGWHLFRHTFASRLAQRGVSLRKISEWLGHADMRTTMIYAHLTPAYDSDIERLHDG